MTMHLMTLSHASYAVCGARGREGKTITVHTSQVTCADCRARAQLDRPEPTPKQKAERALALLIEARELLKDADNKRTVERVRAAISSCKGAIRIQTGRAVRTQLASEAAQ